MKNQSIINTSILKQAYLMSAMRSFAIYIMLMLIALTGKTQNTDINIPAGSMPAGFPVFKDTGNPQADNKKYDEEKKAWVEDNKEVYKRMQPTKMQNSQPAQNEAQTNIAPPPMMIPLYNPIQVSTPVISESLPAAIEMQPTFQTQEAQILPPHYPIVQETGDVAVDEQNHIAAKNKWIAEYPEEYQKASGNLQALQNNTTKIETNIVAKPKIVVPVFDAQKKYKLMVYEAVAAKNQKVSPAQLKEETENINKKDFWGTKTELQISGNEIRLYEPERIELRATEKRNGNKVEWFFENKECASCSKTLYLTIEQESDQAVSYIMQSEDEGDLFAYRLSFQLITKP